MTNCKCGCEVKWCEHIEIERGKYTKYKCAGKSGLSEVIFNFCPECGAKRPECKKNSLAQKLFDAYSNLEGGSVENSISKYAYYREAKAAVEHFCEIVDYCDGFFTSRDCLERLKKKFRQES